MSGRFAHRSGERIKTHDADLAGGTATAAPKPQDGALSVELGTTRHFGLGDLGSAGLLSGWAGPEDGHNWNDGCETVLGVLVSDPGQGCAVEFTGEPFLNERCLRQDVILHVNGFRVGYWRLTAPGSCDLSVRLEPEQLFRRGASALLRCSWSFPMCASPATLGLGEDWRELAFCFRTITVSKA